LLGVFFSAKNVPFLIVFAFQYSSKSQISSEIIREYEATRPQYNQFKVLPYEVKPLLVEHSSLGKFRLTLTPTHFEQTDKSVFSIPVQAKFNEGRIGFELILNASPIKRRRYDCRRRRNHRCIFRI